MPNLPYQTPKWATHTKTARSIRFPIVLDITVLEVTFSYEGPLANYAPLPLKSVEPDYGAAGITLYLCAQGDLENIGGEAIRYTRTWRSLPPDQVTYDRQYITKPDYDPSAAFNPFDVTSGQAVGRGYATHYPTWGDLGAASYSSANGLYTAGDGKVYQPTVVPSVGTLGFATAGTFTLTRGSDTTAALNWNASAATIAAAINALAGVVSDGLTFTVINGLAFSASTGTLNFTIAGGTDTARKIPVTMDATGLTVGAGTSKNPTTAVVGSTIQNIYLPQKLTAVAHGLNPALDAAAVYENAGSILTFVLPAGYWGVIDADTLWVPPYGIYGVTRVGTYSTTLELDAAATYEGGSRFPRLRRTLKFYLPGVSPGITTPADIPVPPDLQNPGTFLTALLTPLTGYQVYQVDGPKPWLDGPIYYVEITEVYFPELT